MLLSIKILHHLPPPLHTRTRFGRFLQIPNLIYNISDHGAGGDQGDRTDADDGAVGGIVYR